MSDSDIIEPEDRQSIWPPHMQLVEHLKTTGRLRYGETIKYTEMASIMNLDLDSNAFKFEAMMFRGVMKGMGFFITQRGVTGGMCIVKGKDTDALVTRRTQKLARQSMNNAIGLANVHDPELTELERQALELTARKCAFISRAIHEHLRRTDLPPLSKGITDRAKKRSEN